MSGDGQAGEWVPADQAGASPGWRQTAAAMGADGGNASGKEPGEKAEEPAEESGKLASPLVAEASREESGEESGAESEGKEESESGGEGDGPSDNRPARLISTHGLEGEARAGRTSGEGHRRAPNGRPALNVTQVLGAAGPVIPRSTRQAKGASVELLELPPAVPWFREGKHKRVRAEVKTPCRPSRKHGLPSRPSPSHTWQVREEAAQQQGSEPGDEPGYKGASGRTSATAAPGAAGRSTRHTGGAAELVALPTVPCRPVRS